MFRNNSKFSFKSIIYMEHDDKESRYYCDLNDINMVYINVYNNSNLKYISNKIEMIRIYNYRGSLDLSKCEKLKYVDAYMDSKLWQILLPKHLKELIVTYCEHKGLYDYDIETLIIYHNHSPSSFPKKLKHLIIYTDKSSFRIDTMCKIPDTLEDILFISYCNYDKYLSIVKGRYSEIYIKGTLCKSITIGDTIINDDTLKIGLFKDEMLNKVKKLNEK